MNVKWKPGVHKIRSDLQKLFKNTVDDDGMVGEHFDSSE